MRKYYIIITLITLLSFNASTPASAQKKVRELNRSGNLLYKKGDYKVAEIDFRKALEINSEDPIARYNLANTLYHTDRTQEAGKLYTESLKKNIEQYTPDRQADLAHNAGNVFMKDKEYEKAVECYKASLRRRPSDEETRYNLALAQKLLEKEKQSGDSGGGQDDKQQDQQQDQQQQDPQQQDQPQQPQEQQMSKENAEKILKAFLQDEKATQQKVDKQKQQSQSRSRQKNW